MIELLDTTCRDGQQHAEISFSSLDKYHILMQLDRLGLAFVELGAPGFNLKDRELMTKPLSTTVTRPCAFGATRRKDTAPEQDEAFRTLIDCPVYDVVLVGKSSIAHVREVLKTTAEENLKMIASSVRYAVQKGKRVIFDAEHFFDGYRLDPDYAMATLAAARENGARRLVLCDTNGGAFPKTVKSVTKEVKNRFPDAVIGVHCHNDNGLALANTLAAIEGGATHVQGTLLGFGERCGNLNLSTLIPLLTLGMGIELTPEVRLGELTPIARGIAEIANVNLPDNMPYVGRAAFAHKAGMHADGVLKDRQTFEFIDPALVGNARRLLLSDAAGKHLLLNKLQPYFPTLTKDDPALDSVAAALKERESNGYSYEGAEASFVLLANRILHGKNAPYDVVNYSLNDNSEEGEASAQVSVRVGSAIKTATARGLGPVHALDITLRKCLVSFYPFLNACNLIDYKVRVVNPSSATGAVVRVLITSSDGKHIWQTVGVSPDIIRASFDALTESYDYALTMLTNER